MKTNYTIQASFAKRLIMAVAVVLMTCGVWGTTPTLAELNLGTPIVSDNFNSLSPIETKPGKADPGGYSNTKSEQTAYGIFTDCYVGKASNIGYGIYEAATPFSSQYLKVFGNGSNIATMYLNNTNIKNKGAFDIYINADSEGFFGIYSDVDNSNEFSKGKTVVFFKISSNTLYISDGNTSTHTWNSVKTSLSGLTRVTVIYNFCGSTQTYNGISIANAKAHVYVNGTSVMDGDNPKAFTIPTGRNPYYFRINSKYSAGLSIDDIKIYDALPTQAGNTITLDKNNDDASGSSSGSAIILADATSMSSISAPTRTGYTLEGYYTAASAGTKIASSAGALQADVTVSAVAWTNGSSQWKKGGDATFFAYWTANDYTVTLDDNGGSGGSGSTTVTYKANTNMTDVDVPTRTHYTFDGYWTSSDGGTTLTTEIINEDGEWKTSVSGYTDATPNWIYAGDVTLYAKWNERLCNNYRTICASDLTLIGPTGNLVFVTSTASKTVRSQEAFHLEGYGLTRSQEVTFDFGSEELNGKFAFKTSTGGTVQIESNGTIDTDIYLFYTPGSGDTSDGLDVVESVTASVSGVKPGESELDTKTIIGRHLPANFVIAGMKDNKWYAMPSNMSTTTNPAPSEIIVNDINNPSVAYTVSTNMYGLTGPTNNNISSGNGQYIRLTMSIDDGTIDPHAAPLFGSATGTRTIGKSGNAQATSDLSAGYWWALEQTNTSITNPQDAKYTIKCANNTSTLSLRDNAGNPDWGLFASGVEELRLIPAYTADVVEAYFIEWGENGGVIEVDAQGISATKVTATFKGSTDTQTLVQTKTSGGQDSKYNYTLAFDGINLAAADAVNNILLLEWYEEDDDLAGVTSIMVPKIVTGNLTMSSITKTIWQGYDEVHILPGGKLTANTASISDYGLTLKHLEIYPGATLSITSGSYEGTITVTNLVLRNGWTRADEKDYGVARLYITPKDDSKNIAGGSLVATNAYADWYIDYDQYYPIAVPWNVTVANNITYKNSNSSAASGMKLRYFDGAERANPATSVSNWKLFGAVGNRPTPTYLEPGKGYALTAKRPSGKAFAIIRMPLTIPSASWTALGEQGRVTVDAVTTCKDTVHVTGWGVGNSNVPWYAIGWNFIANPYMATFKCDNEGTGDDAELAGMIAYENGTNVRYVNIPDIDFQNFDQVNVTEATIKPSSGFFIQANYANEQAITFNSSKIVAPSAPGRYLAASADAPDQEAYIRLTGEGCRDQMGIIIGSDYTEAYDFNADLAKLLGETNALKTYMHYTDMDMAYLAINEQLAREEIPVTVKIPAAGEYTYSLRNSSTVDQLDGLYLVDYQTGVTTNLIFDDYTFTAEAGTFANRFAINAIVGERQVPTEVDISGADKMKTEPVKFIWHDKVFILHHGVIYDSTGKRVNEINK